MTPWLAWFLDALQRALDAALEGLVSVLGKARFWQRWAQVPFNERQVFMLNRALDAPDGHLSTARWAKLTRCSNDTALRDLQVLLKLGVIRRLPAGGRSTSYEIAPLTSA